VSGSPVVFVGAGSGEAGLLTVRGQRALAEAQVVVFDPGLSASLLDFAPDGTERIRVAGGIDDGGGGVPRAAVPALLVDRATTGLRVVRLLAGDAGDFGAEGQALAAAGVAFEAVPGVTPAMAAAVCAGIPPHGPDLGRTVTLDLTDPASVRVAGWRRLATVADTLLLQVSAASLPAVVQGLIRGGRDRETPAALITAPASFRQRTTTATLGELAGAPEVGPGERVVLVVGEVARLRPKLA
jgi:siroheme synthase